MSHAGRTVGAFVIEDGHLELVEAKVHTPVVLGASRNIRAGDVGNKRNGNTLLYEN